MRRGQGKKNDVQTAPSITNTASFSLLKQVLSNLQTTE